MHLTIDGREPSRNELGACLVVLLVVAYNRNGYDNAQRRLFPMWYLVFTHVHGTLRSLIICAGVVVTNSRSASEFSSIVQRRSMF